MNVLAFVLASALAGVQDPQAAPPGQAPDPQRAPMPLPVVVALHRGDRRIDIDGSVLDWPELPVIELSDARQLSGTANGAWRSAADLSGQAFVMWDEHDLYFAAVVRDEWHRGLDHADFTVLETPIADSVVLSFDPKRDTRALGPEPHRADDVELWLGDEASHIVLQWDRFRGTARQLDGRKGDVPATDQAEVLSDESRVVVSHDKEQSITTYEMRVAWSALLAPGQEPKVGMPIDAQIVINDFDEGTDPMPQTRIGWTFGCSIFADSCLMGTIVLVDRDGKVDGERPLAPPRREVEIAEDQTREHWGRFVQRLRACPPTQHDGSRAPEEAGGSERFRLLDELDHEIERFPRVDFVEFLQRQHRQMQREVAAAELHGLPSFWEQSGRIVAKEAAEPALPATARLFRLPQGGWIVRGERYAFAIDPSGGHVSTSLWGLSDFAVLTEPMNVARRNDMLLLRMLTATPPRSVYQHIAFHLPRLLMSEARLVTPGYEILESDGVRVHVMGETRPDGKVPFALGYRLELPGKLTLVVAGATLRAQDVPDAACKCQALVLTAENPAAIELARRIEPDLVFVDGAFACYVMPGRPRVELSNAYAMQKVLLPTPSVLLAPGESWELTRRR